MSQLKFEAFNVYQNIHFIGIGGIGISALARLLVKNGRSISGSDSSVSKNSELLVSEGIDVKIGHSADNIPADTGLIIYTTAIPDQNPEILESKRRNLKLMSYPQAVGELTRHFRSICVCGTHGKTTTTAMIGHLLKESQLDPTVIVGSIVKEFGNKNELLGNSDLLVLESCEYQESFLNYSPEIVVLNNIDPEHLDYFGNAENYLNAFRKFIDKIPAHGLLVANGDDENIQKLLSEKLRPYRIITFGRSQSNDFQLHERQLIDAARNSSVSLNLSIPGPHNLMNASAAFIVGTFLGLPAESTVRHINSFQGTSRRFEIKGKIGKTVVIDDYGHAPAEITATLQSAREVFGEKAKILCIFQPHQYSRTYYLLKEFGGAFNLADKVYIPNIYRSRDTASDLAKVNVDTLVKEINLNKSELAENSHDFDETFQKTLLSAAHYDAIITMGAGDITNLSTRLSGS